jgi:hypothetical protein
MSHGDRPLHARRLDAARSDEVLDHYSVGGRTIRSGPHQGNGRKSPFRDPLVVGARLSLKERADLKAFLDSLTDADFLSNPRFSNPWTSGANAAPSDRHQKFPVEAKP